MSDDGSFVVREPHPLPDGGFCDTFIALSLRLGWRAVFQNTKVLLPEFGA
jgi:hypothetical protein